MAPHVSSMRRARVRFGGRRDTRLERKLLVASPASNVAGYLTLDTPNKTGGVGTAIIALFLKVSIIIVIGAIVALSGGPPLIFKTRREFWTEGGPRQSSRARRNGW